MSVFVVDASVVLKWLVPEVKSDDALRLLDAPHEYVAPDLLFLEAANAIWKKVRRGELIDRDGQQLVADLETVAVDSIATRDLADDAFTLAVATGRTVYDSAYLALAIRLETQVVTADERLVNAIKAVPSLASYICAVEAFAS